MADKKYFLAFDLGASSGRAILGTLENGKLDLQEVHRFEMVTSAQVIHFIGIIRRWHLN